MGKRVNSTQWPTMQFEGEAVVEAYLTPYKHSDAVIGCAAHSDPSCLCDVDVSKTEGMSFDQTPLALRGVTTVEDLYRVAANWWLNLDVLSFEIGSDYGALLEIEDLELARELVLGGCDRAELSAAVSVDIPPTQFALLRRLCGVRNNVARDVELDFELVRKHWEAGMTSSAISRAIRKETGVNHDHRKITTMLEARGCEPHRAFLWDEVAIYNIWKECGRDKERTMDAVKSRMGRPILLTTLNKVLRRADERLAKEEDEAA